MNNLVGFYRLTTLLLPVLFLLFKPVQSAAQQCMVFPPAPCVLPPGEAVDSFDFSNGFPADDTLNLVGDAQADGAAINLTPPDLNKAGAAWYWQNKIQVRQPFITRFSFTIDSLSPGNSEGEGLAFVIAAESPSELGGVGEQLGYGGIPNSIAIEFDYRQNSFDPDTGHVAVNTMGSLPNSPSASIITASLNGDDLDIELEGGSHSVCLLYTGECLILYLDGQNVLNDLFHIPTLIDVDTTGAYFGFTASTSFGHARHRLTSWSFAGEFYKPDRLSCQPGFYQVIDQQLHKYNSLTQGYDAIGLPKYDVTALGYSIADSLIYGIDNETNSLVFVDVVQGTWVNRGKVEGLFWESYAGDFDEEGNFYLFNNFGQFPNFLKIDIDDLPLTAITLPQLTGDPVQNMATDIAYAPNDDVFYSVTLDGDWLLKISHDSSTVTRREITGLPDGNYGAIWIANGREIYVSENDDGDIYWIDRISGIAYLVAKGSPKMNNDAASCPLQMATIEGQGTCMDGEDNDLNLLADCLDVFNCICDCGDPLSGEEYLFAYSDFFFDIEGLQLSGSADTVGDVLRLTPEGNFQTGAAWYVEQEVRVQDGFTTYFNFRVSDVGSSGDASEGGEGLAFVIQATPYAVPEGEGGPSMGYGGIPNSIAIEFDTKIDNWDPPFQHVSIQSNPIGLNSPHSDYTIGEAVVMPPFSDQFIHQVKIHYENKNLEVYVDDMSTPLIFTPLDLQETLNLGNTGAWVGLTGATGNLDHWENHDILCWKFVGTPYEEAPFACENDFFLSFFDDIGRYDPASDSFPVLGPRTVNLQSIGYDPESGYVYGLMEDLDDLVRIDRNRNEVAITTGAALDDFYADVGCVGPNQEYYTFDFSFNHFIRIIPHPSGIPTEATSTLSAPFAVKLGDIVYDPVTDAVYGVNDQGYYLIRIDLTPFVVAEFIPLSGLPNISANAIWMTAERELYIMDSGDHDIYFVDRDEVNDRAISYKVASPNGVYPFIDGASCPDALAPFEISPVGCNDQVDNDGDGDIDCDDSECYCCEVLEEPTFSYTDFSNRDHLLFEEDTEVVLDVLRLSSGEWSEGSVWYDEKIEVGNGFAASFTFHFSNGQFNNYEPTGIALVLHNEAEAVQNGAVMGYDGYPNVAIEIDPLLNLQEPSENHVAVHTLGPDEPNTFQTHATVAAEAIPIDLKDRKTHQARIYYQNNKLLVFMDTFPEPLLEVEINIADSLNSSDAWIGLVGYTTFIWAHHDILCWEVQSGQAFQPMSLFMAADSISCFGANDGSIQTSVVGGLGPYNYQWDSPLAEGANPSGLPPGSYAVTITDQLDQEVTSSITLGEPDELVANALLDAEVSCHGLSDGQATAVANGGSPDYLYQWDNLETGPMAVNLSAGEHTVTITDAHNCSTTASVTINQPDLLTATVSQDADVSCFGGADGQANATMSGGTPDYVYTWDNGESGPQATMLAAGLHTVTITDARDCQIVESVTITEPDLLEVTAVPIQAVSCFGGSDGQIAAAVSGGTPAYAYAWDNGESTPTAVMLSVGPHQVTVTDNNGCMTAVQAFLTEPEALTAQITSSPESGNNQDGTASVSVSGGTPPYLYAWDSDPPQTDSMAVDLETGEYTVLITDANGCTLEETVVVEQVVGTHSLPKGLHIVISPNPTDGSLAVAFSRLLAGEIQYQIFTDTGELLLQTQTQAMTVPSHQIDLSSFASGVYLLKIHGADWQYAEKVVLVK